MSEPSSSPSHEASDISLRTALWFAAALVVGFVLTAFLVGWFQNGMDHSQRTWPHQPGNPDPQFQATSPTLQAGPSGDLETFRRAEDKALQSYGWVDRKAGVVRLPLQRARELILQRGLPQTGTSMPLPGPHPLPGEAPAGNPLPLKGGVP
jgi:hypothetical protein